MRVLLARVSILSVCILAVSAAPARGQSPNLTSVSSARGAECRRSRPGTLRPKAADEASNAARTGTDAGPRSERLEMRLKSSRTSRTKPRQRATPSVARRKGRRRRRRWQRIKTRFAKAMKEDAVKERQSNRGDADKHRRRWGAPPNPWRHSRI